MSQSLMECSVDTIINIFHQYSVRLGHPDRLNQKEFGQMVKKELPNFLKVGLGSGPLCAERKEERSRGSAGLGGGEATCQVDKKGDLGAQTCRCERRSRRGGALAETGRLSSRWSPRALF